MSKIKIPQMGQMDVDIEPCRVCKSDKLQIFEYEKQISKAGKFWDNDDYQEARYETRIGIKCLHYGYKYDDCETYKECVNSWNDLDDFSLLDSLEYMGKLKEFAQKLIDDNAKLKQELVCTLQNRQ